MIINHQTGTIASFVGSPAGSMSGGYVTRSGTNLLFAPDASNRVFCYESSVWTEKTIPDAGITVACTGLTADTDYFLYVYDNAGTLTLDLSTTGTASQNGILVKSGTTSRTLVAHCRANASGAVTTYVEDASTHLVCNTYNRRQVLLHKTDTTNSWTYQSGTIRAMNNSTANRVQFVANGIEAVHGQTLVFAIRSSAGDVPFSGIDLDGTTANDAQIYANAGGITDMAGHCFSHYTGTPSLGFHFLQAVEKCNGTTAACTFIGDNNSTFIQSGIHCTVRA